MEGGGKKEEESLPPGFRFHPTDEELIKCYLMNKVSEAGFSARAIADVDLNKSEPWDLPEKAKMGEKEWYFFSLRDRKYPTGVRTNRATTAGYWKTTGKDKEIYNGQAAAAAAELVGMKKTLVFYKGRAPRGEKTNWVMHEYRLHSKSSSKSNKDEWVVCRVFAKSPGGKKYPSNHSRPHPYSLDMGPPLFPTLHLPHDPFTRGAPYLTHADLAELSRFARGTPGLHPHIQPHPSVAGGYAGHGAPFTLSGLNLNLGAGAPIPPLQLPMHGMSAPMNQQSAPQMMPVGPPTAPWLGSCIMTPNDGGFGADASAATVRYANLDVDQLVERYWPANY